MSMFEQMRDSITSGHDKADEIIALLALNCRQQETLIEVANAQLAHDEYLTRSDQTIVPASGIAEIEIVPRVGFIIQLVSLAVTCASVGTGPIAVYRNSSDNGQNLLYANAGAQLLTDQFPTGTIIPENTKIVFRFSGLPAGGTVTASITGKRLRLHEAMNTRGVPF